MAAQFGRTVNKYVNVIIGDTGDVLRTLPVVSIGDVGLTYEEKDLTAWLDAVKGILLDQPDFSCDITCIFDNTATTGSHTVLSALNGVNTPRMFDFQAGIQHAWTAGEPQFGITKSAANGILVSNYTVQPEAGTCKCTIKMFAGSAAPAWGTAAEA